MLLFQHFNGLPDVLSTELQSLNLHADVSGNRLSFLLIDAKDRLTVGSEDDFALMLGCQSGADDQGGAVRAKVVSMVGNTGEGKSYALNKALFLQGKFILALFFSLLFLKDNLGKLL